MLRTGTIAAISAMCLICAATVAESKQGYRTDLIDRAITLRTSGGLATDDTCLLNRAIGDPNSYFAEYQAGDITLTLFEPVDCGDDPTYPFAIRDLSFTLFDDGAGTMVWPVAIDIVIFDMTEPANPCAGPGAELKRYSISCDSAIFAYPNVGKVEFWDLCCVTTPFFMGLEYTDGVAGTLPSVVFDNTATDTCDNWIFRQSWYDWHSFWAAPAPGYPIFWVGGRTASTSCGTPWEPGDPHKMHAPQLSDDDGWAVETTQPFVLADDWVCSDAGWVKGVHFWGAWRASRMGPIDSFVIRIHDNVPADPPQEPFAHPGVVLSRVAAEDFLSVEISNPTAGSWYDPSTGMVLPGDHEAYYQYDVTFRPDDWFWQDWDSTYWVSISAWPYVPNHWGWKTTDSVANSAAVWALTTNWNWLSLHQPGQVDLLDLSFVVTGDDTGCCLSPLRGNVNYDDVDEVNILDLTTLVRYLFAGGAPPPCSEEADFDADGLINVHDLTLIVDYLFDTYIPPEPCP